MSPNFGHKSSFIWEQIVSEIKEKILIGELCPKEKLPSVREMSESLDVNPNTVAKAYKELKRQNLIRTIRGKGTFVSEESIKKMNESHLYVIKQSLKLLVIESCYLGIDKNTFLGWTENYLDELEIKVLDSQKSKKIILGEKKFYS